MLFTKPNKLFTLIGALVILLSLIAFYFWVKNMETLSTDAFLDCYGWSGRQLPSSEFYIRMLSTGSPPRGDPFDAAMNVTEMRATLRLMWKFLDLCEAHIIEAMLYGGSLIGSYRHHGFIPWDDDVDLLIKESDKNKLRKALNGHSDLQLKEGGRWKVSSKSDCLNVAAQGCWPFMDLSFYKLQDGWVIDLHDSFGVKYRYPVKYTLPVHKRPFMGRWVDSPRDALKFLSFDIGQTAYCSSLHYSHKFERYPDAPVKTIGCKSLANTYPFVSRIRECTSDSRGVLEALKFAEGGPVYTVRVDEPADAINVEYSTELRKP